ncbi:MAG: protein TonB [Chlamydiales bacterium]|jgi:protein TonB
MQAEDRPRASVRTSYWGRSTVASIAMHVALVSIGIAVPLVWTGSRPARANATVWATFERPEPDPFDERPEPELRVEVSPRPMEHPAVATIPVEPEPFPEQDPNPPLEPVDWAADGMRRASLEPIFAVLVEPEDVEVAEVDPVASPLVTDEELTPAPVEIAARALADHCPAPIYPRRAHRMGWYGTVVCSLTVGADGLVRAVLVLQSSGHDLLDETVLRTLNTWRFAPATRDGMPTESQLIRRFRFDLPS